MSRPILIVAMATLPFLLTSCDRPAEVPELATTFTNLQVLPANISAEDLSDVMQGNLRGLGLRRRQSEGCLYCHVGSLDVSRDNWDYASDQKHTKRKARVMMRMVWEINERLSSLESRVAPDLEVTCYTCHAGRTDPRGLLDVLQETLDSDGIEATAARYRDLRDRYYGGDAYDFRPGVLLALAFDLADQSRYTEALTVAELNAESNPEDEEVHVDRRLVELIQLVGTAGGVEAAVKRADEWRESEVPGTTTHVLLDNLGWWVSRRDRRDEGLVLFRHNLKAFPGEYIPKESLADGLWFNGQRATAIELFEGYVKENPENAMASRRLATLRQRFAEAAEED